MPSMTAKPMQPNCTITAEETNKIRYVYLTSFCPHINRSNTVPTGTQGSLRRILTRMFPTIFRVDQMHRFITPWFVLSPWFVVWYVENIILKFAYILYTFVLCAQKCNDISNSDCIWSRSRSEESEIPKLKKFKRNV